MLIAGLVVWFVLAMLPGRIARSRNHSQADAINVAGWLGALFFGAFWPLAVIWAFTKPGDVLFKRDPTIYQAAVDAKRAQVSFQALRLQQYRQLASRDAGTRFQVEQTQAEADRLASELQTAAIYTDSAPPTHVIRKVMLRMESILNHVKPSL